METSQQVDGLIILDRNTDWMTPMMTMLTYEGLLAEYVGLQNCRSAGTARAQFASGLTTLQSFLAHIEVDPNTLSTENNNRTGTTDTSNPMTSSLGAATMANPQSTKKRKHLLSSATDPLFGELRDSNFSVVGAKLARHAKRLEAEYQGKNSLDTVGKMKEFVGKLGGLQGEQRALKLRKPRWNRLDTVLSL
jgi:hypothetical protein